MELCGIKCKSNGTWHEELPFAMSNKEVVTPHSEIKTNRGDDPQNSKGGHGSEKALSKTVKELVKVTVEEELAKLKAGARMEHPRASGSLHNAG